MIAMGALNMGVKEDELADLIINWRKANPAIVKMWGDFDRASKAAVKNREKRTTPQGITFDYTEGLLFMALPSGRKLAYMQPMLEEDPRMAGRMKLTYAGVGDTKRWERLDTYGAKLVENCIQAIARDCLAVAMLRLDAAGYKIAFHVHDEVVLDMPIGEGSLADACAIMAKPISWAAGLPLKADGCEMNYYRKD